MFGWPAGFDSSKCKTLLGLTCSRIRVLRSRSQWELKAKRQQVAQLLKERNFTAASIKLESLIFDQNRLDAFEMVDLFCQLITVRMPFIESHRDRKDYPLDTLEAISSVVFAAGQCGELEELGGVREQMGRLLGREFLEEVESREPKTALSDKLVSKLSIQPPLLHAKLVQFSKIADDFAVDFDPLEFEESISLTVSSHGEGDFAAQATSTPVYLSDLPELPAEHTGHEEANQENQFSCNSPEEKHADLGQAEVRPQFSKEQWAVGKLSFTPRAPPCPTEELSFYHHLASQNVHNEEFNPASLDTLSLGSNLESSEERCAPAGPLGGEKSPERDEGPEREERESMEKKSYRTEEEDEGLGRVEERRVGASSYHEESKEGGVHSKYEESKEVAKQVTNNEETNGAKGYGGSAFDEYFEQLERGLPVEARRDASKENKGEANESCVTSHMDSTIDADELRFVREAAPFRAGRGF